MTIKHNKLSNNIISTEWLKQGWEIFKSNPWIWLGIIIAMAIMVGILNRFGIIGQLASSIIAPIFAGGIFLMIFVVFLIAMISFRLGMIIAIPVIFCANYAVYDSIFAIDKLYHSVEGE